MTKTELRCKHRHSEETHPNCFKDGLPVDIFPPKVLLLDVETLPLIVYSFGLFNQYIRPDQVIKDWAIVSWAAKWLFDSEIISDVMSIKEAKSRDDSKVISKMWKLLNEADIVIGHNVKGFDIKKLNTRFFLHGYPPPMYYQVVDTLSVLKKNFDFSSNKLDYVNGLLGIEQKDETSFELWVQCSDGDKDALEKMHNYNINDVRILEDLYVSLMPWISDHPNLGLYVDTDEEVCRVCGNTDLQWGGYYRTNTNIYRAFRCSCGAIGRSKSSVLTDNERKIITL